MKINSMFEIIILLLAIAILAAGKQESLARQAKSVAVEDEKLLLRSEGYRPLQGRNEFVEAMNEILFPNRSDSMFPFKRRRAMHDPSELSDRKLQTDDAYTEEVPCVICRDMEYCDALNGLQIEEVYLPNNLNDLGTCRVLDELGNKVRNEVFGNGRSFRDTTQCNDIVMQYLCLFYGSDNDMYRNHCIYQEDVSDSNPVNHKVAPRPPCRSFCVQVAEVCANDPKFMQLCNNIACPPMEDSCTPDPSIEGQVLAANIGCDMPYDINPYFKPSSAPRGSAVSKLATLLCGVFAVGATLFLF